MADAYNCDVNIRTVFSARLKELREEMGLSQSALADQLKISRGSMSFYENLDRVPDIEVLHKFARFFNVTSDYLIGLSPCKTKKELAKQALAEEYDKMQPYSILLEFDSFYKLLELLEQYLFNTEDSGREEDREAVMNTLEKFPDKEAVLYKQMFLQAEKSFYYDDLIDSIVQMRNELSERIGQPLIKGINAAVERLGNLGEIVPKAVEEMSNKLSKRKKPK